VARVESQVKRYKTQAEAAEATEDSLKAEKRKLQREVCSNFFSFLSRPFVWLTDLTDARTDRPTDRLTDVHSDINFILFLSYLFNLNLFFYFCSFVKHKTK